MIFCCDIENLTQANIECDVELINGYIVVCKSVMIARNNGLFDDDNDDLKIH